MTVQLAKGSVSASTILTRLKARLVASLLDSGGEAVDDSFVRIVAKPNPTYASYKPEEGVALILHSPEPSPRPAGANRHGLLVRRIVEVHVATQSLLDRAGQEEQLVAAHTALEEQVVNAIQDFRPTDLQVPDTERVGLFVQWVPGGPEIERQVRLDPGMAFSALLFEVTYVAPLSVNREDGV